VMAEGELDGRMEVHRWNSRRALKSRKSNTLACFQAGTLRVYYPPDALQSIRIGMGGGRCAGVVGGYGGAAVRD
jgi:hypothetical protein